MPRTSIEWTDLSWPVVNGCCRISAGCGKSGAGGCYAERLAATRLKHTRRYAGLAIMTAHGPQWTGETRLVEAELEMPLRVRRPSRIFVADMGDLFYERVADEVIDRVWAVMALAPQHTFQVLTKRPDRMRRYIADPSLYDRVLHTANEIRGRRPKLTQIGISNPATFPLSNVWLGVSVEDQTTADERIPLLLECPAALRFVSYEPALGPVDFRSWLRGKWRCSGCGLRTSADVGRCKGYCYDASGRSCDAVACPRCAEVHYWSGSSSPDVLEWIIVGGESGPGARPFDVAWARSTIEQCRAAGLPCFTKQLGAHVITRNDDNFTVDDDPGDPDFPGWPLHLVAEDRIEGNEPYQGAPVRVRLRDPKGGDPSEWRADLRVRQFPEVRR